MRSALIGWSGLVGGTLSRQTTFVDRFRSSDIDTIRGREYDLVVCAGMPAAKWLANKEPERDLETLERLWGALSQVRTKRLVVISTVDVFAQAVGVDEQTSVQPEQTSAYGRHRYELERRASDSFEATVVRLPALFGEGLKKNVVYDLLHDNMLQAICPESVFQFYPLSRLWSDLGVALRDRLALVHLTVEGTPVTDVARVAFGKELPPRPDLVPVRYDLRTVYSTRFGSAGSYLMTAGQVLAAMREYVAAERGGV